MEEEVEDITPEENEDGPRQFVGIRGELLRYAQHRQICCLQGEIDGSWKSRQSR